VGDNPAVGFVRLIVANRPRYGGYVVHLAVVMVALGVVGQSFYGVQRDVALMPGESVTVEGYTLEYVDTTALAFSDRTEFRTTVEVYRDGELLEVMHPQRTFHPDFNMASTRAAIRSTPVEDFYVVPSENREDGAVGFRILVNPLVWWMWVAGPVMILGTLIALWPARAPVRRPVTVASPAASAAD
jgi:cytochrome c-type biogenesis protein CcmF